MEISAKNIKGFKVYIQGDDEPWGIITDVRLNENTAKIETIIAKTLSIVPIRKMFGFGDIKNIIQKAVVLKKDSKVMSYDEDGEEKQFSGIRYVTQKGRRKVRLKDVQFDFETGEITDVIVSNNKFKKKNSIKINKIYVEDNTIYVENEGRNKNV